MAGPLVRIYGAITFYLENKDEIAAYLKDQERLWRELETITAGPADSLNARLHAAKEHA